MDFRTKQKQIRRQAQEREESMNSYNEHKDEITAYREACAIIARLSRISQNGRYITAEDILNKVNGRAELDYYYRWCI